jgi:hypothetical protein
MRTLERSASIGRATRRRRAVAAILCVFLGGASLGTAVGLTYTRAPRRPYEKAFDSIGLSAAQRRATDSIMARYACVIDSINRTIAPQIDSVRGAARHDVYEVLSDSQGTLLSRALSAGDHKHRQRRSDRRASCSQAADSASSQHGHYLRL